MALTVENLIALNAGKTLVDDAFGNGIKIVDGKLMYVFQVGKDCSYTEPLDEYPVHRRNFKVFEPKPKTVTVDLKRIEALEKELADLKKQAGK